MKVSMTISYANKAATIATSLIEAKQHDDKATSLREGVNKEIAGLHKAKVVIGRLNKCAIATSFVDTLTKGGLAKKTAQNYLSLFKDAVKTGKPVLDWGGTKAASHAKMPRARKPRDSKSIADLFRPAFNHDAGKSFQVLCAEIEARYQNDDLKPSTAHLWISSKPKAMKSKANPDPRNPSLKSGGFFFAQNLLHHVIPSRRHTKPFTPSCTMFTEKLFDNCSLDAGRTTRKTKGKPPVDNHTGKKLSHDFKIEHTTTSL
jgi:hypothetical protein